MERSRTEIKLLTIRQGLLDTVCQLEQRNIVPLKEYRKAMVKLFIVEELLREVRGSPEIKKLRGNLCVVLP